MSLLRDVVDGVCPLAAASNDEQHGRVPARCRTYTV